VAPTTPATVSLLGTVSATGGARVQNATVKIIDGPNAGKTASTNASGEFTFTDLTVGNANVTANASIYDEAVLGTYINGTNRLDFVFAVPGCQSANTGSIAFRNGSATASQDIVWDGARLITLPPGVTSGPIVATAGVAHTVQFLVAGTKTLACSQASPVLTQCERGRVISCSAP
jgi:hypothetical protein